MVYLKSKPRVGFKKMTQLQVNKSFRQAGQMGQIKEVTSNNYIRDFQRIVELLECPTDDIIPCFRNVEKVLSIMQQYYPNISTYKNMLTSIISLCKYNELFAKFVNQEAYLREMNRLRTLVQKNDVEKSNMGQTMPWSYYVQLLSQLKQEMPNSTKYLLLCLYTMIPPVRDNYGKVYIVYDDSLVPNNEHNLYYLNNGRLVLTEYKTDKYYGVIDEVIPIVLQEVIANSLEKYPRKYLITKDNTIDQLYSQNRQGKLSSIFQSRFF